MKRFLSTAVPALLIVAVTVYALAFEPESRAPSAFLSGRPLASYPEHYPVRSDADGALHLDKARFVRAVAHFTEHPSPKAGSDLIYLGQANNVTTLLNDAEKKAYAHLIKQPAYADLRDVDAQRDKIFQVYADIVNGIGQTFQGTGIEIVLHDTRNPLRSVVAIQNPISGRRIGDSTTNFGLELIRDYSITETKGASFVGYGLQLKDGRDIKSSTIPLFDDRYGLVGFICLNIDTSRLDMKDPRAVAAFIDSFKAISTNAKISELIENSKHRKAQ